MWVKTKTELKNLEKNITYAYGMYAKLAREQLDQTSDIEHINEIKGGIEKLKDMEKKYFRLRTKYRYKQEQLKLVICADWCAYIQEKIYSDVLPISDKDIKKTSTHLKQSKLNTLKEWDKLEGQAERRPIVLDDIEKRFDALLG